MNKNLNSMENMMVLLTKRNCNMSPEDKNNIKKLVLKMGEDEWSKLFYISKIHRVHTSIFYNIKELEEEGMSFHIPENIRENFLDGLESSIKNETLLSQEKLFLGKKFKSHNIKVLFLKGISYKDVLYKLDGYRYYKDLDILVDEKDLIQVHNLLIEEGYVTNFYYADGFVEEKYVSRYFDIIPYNVMDYKKIDNNDNEILLDMHKVGQYNIYNTKDFYKNGQSDRNGVYELDLIDLFLYTCYHTYHHYGYDINLINMSNLPKLKLYMDLREMFLKLKKDELLKKLKGRIIEIKAQYVVNEVMKLTELIYDETYDIIPGITDKMSRMNHTSTNPDFFSRFEHRLFRTFDERDRIINYINSKGNKNNEIVNEGYECKKKEPGLWYRRDFWNKYTSYCSTVDNMWFGAYHLYGATTVVNNGRCSSVSFAWDNNYFYMRWYMFDYVVVFGDDEYCNVRQNQLVISFLNNDVKNSFNIQLKNHENHKVFLKNGRAVDAIEASDYKVYLNQGKNEYEAYIKISWKDIQINVVEGEKINFNLCVWVGDQRYEEINNLCFSNLQKDHLFIC